MLSEQNLEVLEAWRLWYYLSTRLTNWTRKFYYTNALQNYKQSDYGYANSYIKCHFILKLVILVAKKVSLLQDELTKYHGNCISCL